LRSHRRAILLQISSPFVNDIAGQGPNLSEISLTGSMKYEKTIGCRRSTKERIPYLPALQGRTNNYMDEIKGARIS
jgi:hypothetical protein